MKLSGDLVRANPDRQTLMLAVEISIIENAICADGAAALLLGGGQSVGETGGAAATGASGFQVGRHGCGNRCTFPRSIDRFRIIWSRDIHLLSNPRTRCGFIRKTWLWNRLGNSRKEISECRTTFSTVSTMRELSLCGPLLRQRN